jgi:hypothetical protein
MRHSAQLINALLYSLICKDAQNELDLSKSCYIIYTSNTGNDVRSKLWKKNADNLKLWWKTLKKKCQHAKVLYRDIGYGQLYGGKP